MAVIPTTKLEAVNVILDVLSEQPVTSLGENQDATNAESRLDEINKRVQSKGWKFNTVQEDFTTDGAGVLTLPTNTAKFDWPRTSFEDPDLVVREIGGVLRGYDVKNNTATLALNKTFKNCSLVQLLDFIELPESARQFIMISAARTFQDRTVGSTTRARFTREDELRAEADLKREHATSGDYNILNGSLVSRAIRGRGHFSGRYSR